MKVSKFFKQIGVSMGNEITVFQKGIEGYVFRGNFYNFWAAVAGDTQYENDVIADKAWEDLDEYHKCLAFADKKLYKGLESNTTKVRIDPVVSKNGVGLVDFTIAIR